MCVSVCLREDAPFMPGQRVSVWVHFRVFVACLGVTDLPSTVQSQRGRKNFPKNRYIMASPSELDSNKTARQATYVVIASLAHPK